MIFNYKLLAGLFIFSCLLVLPGLQAQADQHPIANTVASYAAAYRTVPVTPLLSPLPIQDRSYYRVADEIASGTFLQVADAVVTQLRIQKPELLRLQLPTPTGKPLNLRLYRANIFSDAFQVRVSSAPDRAYPYEPGLYYWGIVEGEETSIAAIAISEDEVVGVISMDSQQYVLGKLNDNTEQVHVLYPESDLQISPNLTCGTDDIAQPLSEDKPGETNGTANKDANSCVRMYIEVDHDIYLGKGGVTQAANYINGAFTQVAVLYANESINLVVNEIFVWNTVDPYTGPSTGNYLDQFQDQVAGNYNGDLAHLVGYQGGGGVAYLDAICSNNFGMGYSDVNSTYSTVPTFSWTVMVLTHEIGHNLGSPHTHACVWNGNNTAIDGCSNPSGCNGPIPTAGTIMSYCHLLNNVGINFNLGFGPQPGNLIRNEVYNNSCLTSCGTVVTADAGINTILNPSGAVCATTLSPGVELKNYGTNPLNSVAIQYKLDGQILGTINWTGNLAANGTTNVTLPAISFSAGSHTFTATTSNPNGITDTNNGNNSKNSSFSFSDSDNDGVCNSQDQCPGGNDNIDNNNNGVPDACDCEQFTAVFPLNPLTNGGSGTSSTSYVFPAGSENISFTVSGLNALLQGRPENLYNEKVTVTYINGSGSSVTYGVYTGSTTASFTVTINSPVQAVTVSLTNAQNNGATVFLSVNPGPITYCIGDAPGPCPDDDNDGVCNANDACPGFNNALIGTPCNDGNACTVNDVYTASCNCAGTYVDSDNDGVCDSQDQCPGGDDTIDTNNNGIPDACDNTGCTNQLVGNFTPNPLTHAGSGASTAQISLPGGSQNASFTISNINAAGGSRPGTQFKEVVTVSYINGNGANQIYGTYQGNVQNSVNVAIAGSVQAITISLSEGIPGGNQNLSINMSAVTACVGGGALQQGEDAAATVATQVQLFPNPTNDKATLSFTVAPERASVVVRDLLGRTVAKYTLNGEPLLELPVGQWSTRSQVYLLTVYLPTGETITRRLVRSH